MPEPAPCLIPQHVFLLYCILVMRDYSIRLSQLRAPATAQTACPLHLENLLLQPGLRSPYPLEASTPPETWICSLSQSKLGVRIRELDSPPWNLLLCVAISQSISLIYPHTLTTDSLRIWSVRPRWPAWSMTNRSG